MVYKMLELVFQGRVLFIIEREGGMYLLCAHLLYFFVGEVGKGGTVKGRVLVIMYLSVVYVIVYWDQMLIGKGSGDDFVDFHGQICVHFFVGVYF